jgi:hypothetical protein
MRYAEGARLFYRALAEGLLIEVGVQSSVQLVVPENVSPPEEDCLALARTMAARHQESLTDPLQFDGTSVDPASLPSRPLVLDCRHLDPEILVTRFRPHFESRADVVVLVTAEVPLLRCRVVSFDWNSQGVFNAVTQAFIELVRQVGFRGQALEMPSRFLTQGLRGVQGEFRLFESTHRLVLSREEIERFCVLICRNWCYCGTPVSGATVHNWVLQFEPHGVQREAMCLLEHLNRDGFIPKGEIINRLLRLYADLTVEPGPSPQSLTQKTTIARVV